MAYRFEPTATVADNVHRVADEQFERAISELTDGVTRDPVEAVHSARKAIKMERSLLRLLRGSIRPKARRRENDRMRQAAARLSGARDADVIIDALDGLTERYAGRLPEATFRAIRGRLEHDRDSLRTGLQVSGLVEESLESLRLSRAEIAGWNVRGRGFDAVASGLGRSYAHGREAMARAQRRPTVENLHDWRKRVKDLWYHLRLLEPAAPLMLAGHVGEAHALADLLGDDHDLAVLRGTVLGMAPDLPIDHAAVVALIDHRRREIAEDATLIGRRLYAEKTAAFLRRLERYWTTAEKEARAVAARDAAALDAEITRARP